MRIGITGHQEREGVDWAWVKSALEHELTAVGAVQKAFSSLAAGTDQMFAEVALERKIPVVAVLPLESYERFFEGPALRRYQLLLPRCEVIQLRWSGNPKQAFFTAGRYVVHECDLLFAVWDGQSAEGLGGTGDVVDYAVQIQRPVIHINPCSQKVSRIPS